jgi:hypothetical protein
MKEICKHAYFTTFLAVVYRRVGLPGVPKNSLSRFLYNFPNNSPEAKSRCENSLPLDKVLNQPNAGHN